MSLLSLHLNRYLFTLDLPDYWENKHADQTLEVLMSDLDPAIMDQFYMKDGVSASDVTRVSGRLLAPSRLGSNFFTMSCDSSPCLAPPNALLFRLQMSGIRDLIPGSVIDATMFNPCGYSMNGMKADVSVSGGGGSELTLSKKREGLSNSCFLVSREPTGRSTSPQSRSSPTSASRPTSPRPPMTTLCGRLWRFSSRGSLLPHFLSIRYDQHLLFFCVFFFYLVFSILTFH